MLSSMSFEGGNLILLTVSAGIFVLAGFVKGVVGLGLPTVAVGLLGLFLPPLQVASLLIAPSLVTNVWQLLAGGRIWKLLRRLWPMLVGIVVGTLSGSDLMAEEGDNTATGALGFALVAYALLGLSEVRFQVSPRIEKWLSPVIGVATGLTTAATAVFVIPAVPYVQAMNLEKDELIQALGLSFTVSTISMTFSLVHGGSLHTEGAVLSFVALVPALGGMFVGQWLRSKIPAAMFRRFFFLGLLMLGVHLGTALWR